MFAYSEFYTGQVRAAKTSLLALGLLFGIALSPLNHACDKPLAPDLPDPTTAVLAEMVKAQNEVKQYIKQGGEYLKCVKDDAQHDLVVDEMRDIGIKFNDIVKGYKVRVASK